MSDLEARDIAFDPPFSTTCERCNGTGEIKFVPAGLYDWEIDVCPECHGTGYEPRTDSREDDAYEESREQEEEMEQ